MDITETTPGLYEVASESSTKTYFVDVRGKGVDGDPHTCTCTRYAINKNRAGGDGFQGETCKHLREIYGMNGLAGKQPKQVGRKINAKAKEDEEAENEFERIRTAASLESMLKDLENL